MKHLEGFPHIFSSEVLGFPEKNWCWVAVESGQDLSCNVTHVHDNVIYAPVFRQAIKKFSDHCVEQGSGVVSNFNELRDKFYKGVH